MSSKRLVWRPVVTRSTLRRKPNLKLVSGLIRTRRQPRKKEESVIDLFSFERQWHDPDRSDEKWQAYRTLVPRLKDWTGFLRRYTQWQAFYQKSHQLVAKAYDRLRKRLVVVKFLFTDGDMKCDMSTDEDCNEIRLTKYVSDVAASFGIPHFVRLMDLYRSSTKDFPTRTILGKQHDRVNFDKVEILTRLPNVLMIVMEKLRPEPLNISLPDKPLTTREFLAMLFQVLAALTFMYRLGLRHGDLHAGNVLVSAATGPNHLYYRLPTGEKLKVPVDRRVLKIIDWGFGSHLPASKIPLCDSLDSNVYFAMHHALQYPKSLWDSNPAISDFDRATVNQLYQQIERCEFLNFSELLSHPVFRKRFSRPKIPLHAATH